MGTCSIGHVFIKSSVCMIYNSAVVDVTTGEICNVGGNQRLRFSCVFVSLKEAPRTVILAKIEHRAFPTTTMQAP
jgi:hypothetical protein